MKKYSILLTGLLFFTASIQASDNSSKPSTGVTVGFRLDGRGIPIGSAFLPIGVLATTVASHFPDPIYSLKNRPFMNILMAPIDNIRNAIKNPQNLKMPVRIMKAGTGLTGMGMQSIAVATIYSKILKK